MVTTKRSFAFTYGYVQVVAQIPGGPGTWPALWLLPQTTEWPPEIDIMENFGAPNSIRTTYIEGTADAPVQAASQNVLTSSNLTNSYHTYGLLWKPGSLTWYLDGKVISTFNSSTVSHQPMYFLANLAIDGQARSGSSFNIRSVKIYK
jgi:beta-glucanase (GH16 family)